MLERVLQPWPVSSKYSTSHSDVPCCIAVTKALGHSSTPFASNGLRKKAARSLSDAAIFYSLRNYINDLDNSAETHYFSDSEITVSYYRKSSQDCSKPTINASDFQVQLCKTVENNIVTLPLQSPPTSPPEKVQKEQSPKKRVRFADDNGLELTDVKIIDNNYSALFEAVFEAEKPRNNFLSVYNEPPMHYRWIMEFCVPSRQYASFREKVNTRMVSLENIHIDEEGPPCLCGSIKVKNISYRKNVFIRFTYNSWATSEDRLASHQPCRERHPQFDAFVFRIPLKRPVFSGERIEFAVCFQTNESEFWDSNNFDNYLLTSHAFLSNQVQQLHSPQRQYVDVSLSKSSSIYSRSCFTDFRIWDRIPIETTYY